MKLMAFADLHSNITDFKKLQAKIKKSKPDYIVCLGDFTLFEQNMEAILDKINDLGAPVYMIHGNHESELVLKKLCKRYQNITFVHKTIMQLGEYILVSHGGGGFYGRNARDKDFEAFIKENKDKLKGKIIFATHAPPAHTKLDHIAWLKDYVGCQSYTDFIDQYQPMLAISGHIHETFYLTYKKNKTILSNPGPDGTLFLL